MSDGWKHKILSTDEQAAFSFFKTNIRSVEIDVSNVVYKIYFPYYKKNKFLTSE